MDLIKEFLGGVALTIFVVMIFIFLNQFQKSLPDQYPEAKQVLEQSKESIWNAYLLWEIVGGATFVIGIVIGIIILVRKFTQPALGL